MLIDNPVEERVHGFVSLLSSACPRDARLLSPLRPRSGHLSREALVTNAFVTIRTVQRFEAGQAINTSRWIIARALGDTNPDIFDDPKFIETVLEFFDRLKAMQQQNLDAQHPLRHPR
ncbi:MULTISPECIES: hypothetical protein [unclassified Bradyrhizobium]|uniref:hypothetical protein n=1 Tax=unclassified Bradyrhizobium TaxID=2631580 RepID=UPI00247926B6|nr:MULTISPECIES: hypothetical protein [unclassified Bradyrhizobium]WGS19286.1 hypothetical protein MTX22_33465 [Bradyrhizobium sp. ISRA463]WGS26121.1 hypothetical protein MTX19_30970 [Bradyrhizobium sp. ISRA464]